MNLATNVGRRNRLLLRSVAWIAFAAPAIFAQATAGPQPAPTPTQTGAPTQPLAFDVVSIKPHNPAGGISFRPLPDGGFIAKGTILKDVACEAYDVLPSACLGGPAWFTSDRFDIEAKPDGAVAEHLRSLTPEQWKKVRDRMIQALFADRLKLKFHQETRELPIFALVVSKGGLKVHEAKAGDTYPKGIKGTDGQSLGSGSTSVGNGKLTAQGISMDRLAEQLTDELGHIVQDHTGLSGVYDFTLHYSDDDTSADSAAPSIFTAIQEQLGLKLESTKSPVSVLVIDHVEKPSEN